jgi:hypothetical protein
MSNEPPRYGERVTPIPVQYEPETRVLTAYEALKVIGFFVVLLGPLLPLTIWLWKLAVG